MNWIRESYFQKVILEEFLHPSKSCRLLTDLGRERELEISSACINGSLSSSVASSLQQIHPIFSCLNKNKKHYSQLNAVEMNESNSIYSKWFTVMKISWWLILSGDNDSWRSCGFVEFRCLEWILHSRARAQDRAFWANVHFWHNDCTHLKI